MARNRSLEVTTAYAEVKWTPEDVRTLRPEWSLKRCERFLRQNQKWIVERLIELGWDVIGDLLPPRRKP